MDCPKCKEKTEHRHMHDAAHGIAETHMVGSERYECKGRGYHMLKEEAEKQGLTFDLD